MAMPEIHSWTLGGLIGAFVDLAIAYFLLCGSACAFVAYKLFMFFGFFLPCPCKGSFGYRNSNFCVHKVLFEWPSRKISSIQVMAVRRFPFDALWLKGHSCNGNDKMVAPKMYDNRLVELEGEASCSSYASPRLLSLVDKENGYDAKGKRVMSLKRRSGIRRRRRSSYDCGKISSVIPSDNLQSDVAVTSCLPCDGSIIRDRTSERIYPASGKEVSVHDVEEAQSWHDLDEKTCHSYEFNGSIVDSPEQDKYSSSLEHCMSNMQDNFQIIGNEGDRIKMLENALKEERAAYAALYQELEKERAASASAADEAMAMISRLQEEKASMEMEMRQYQRMIEERDAYEEEEMNILQEILIRREREYHFLEKELESYRQTDSNGRDGRTKFQLNGQRPPISVDTYEDPPPIESTISIVKKDKIVNILSNYMVAEDYIKTEDGEELEKNTEHKGQGHEDLRSSFYDTEPEVLDVHVVDDNIELREEENEKLHSSSSGSLSNEHDVSIGGPTSQLSMFSNSGCKMLPFDSGSDSSCAVHNEKLKIENELEILGERLRMVKYEKEKLTVFAENRESEKDRLKLLEETANRVQQIKQLRNPVRGASLPPSSTKASLKKRRSQSASWETCESC